MKPRPPEVAISSSQRALRVPRKALAKLAAFVSQRQGVRLAELDLAIVSGGEIAAVNRRFLRHAGDTDVISFDVSDPTTGGLSVQLVVCAEVAVRQAPHHGNTPQQELMVYVIHGLLHHMGYDDTTVRSAAAMHARQDELLREFLAARRRAR